MKRIGFSTLPSALWVVLLTAACVIPFANKAFYIDDPLFLWAARHMRVSPGEFYNFKVNWFGFEMAMTDATCNPPLMSLILALVSVALGWGEMVLHLTALVPAVAVALGTFELAKKFSTRPVLAATLVVLTPGFLVCSTSVMCDITMLALWVWSLVWWERGLNKGVAAYYIFASVLAGSCGLAKYSGLAVLPLLLAYAAVRRRKPGFWILAFLIPVAMLGAYEWFAYRTYGVVLFSNAAAYAKEVRPATLADLPGHALTALVFAGGCALPVIALAPCLWSKRGLLIGAGLLVFIMVAPPVLGTVLFAQDSSGVSLGTMARNGWLSLQANWFLNLQRAVWLLGGTSIVLLAIDDLRRTRDATSILLGLWVLGILVFASAFNWTINGRSVLPLLPAVALLLVRRLDRNFADDSIRQAGEIAAENAPTPLALRVCLGVAAASALAVSAADYGLANAAREGANTLSAKYTMPTGTLWFQGHWGFQYYLQDRGAQPVDFLKSALNPGDIILVPSGNASNYKLPTEATKLVEVLELKPNSWLTTMDRSAGAGFHSDFWGPVPFAFGAIEPERFYVIKVVQPFAYSSWNIVLPAATNQTPVQALAGYEEKLRTDPKDSDTRFLSAMLMMKQSQVPAAAARLEEGLRDQPGDFRTHAQLARLYESLGKSPQAKTHYTAALEALPDALDLLNSQAWLLATDADPVVRNGDEAVRLAERAVALTLREDAMALGTLAAAYAEAGRFSDAIATAEKARDLATTTGQIELVQRNTALLEVYRHGKAYHAPGATEP